MRSNTYLRKVMNKKICIGAGLVSLDILMRGNEDKAVSYKVGGTCGNVMMILANMGWETYPIARLNGSDYSRMMLDDMKAHGVHTNFVSTLDDGATPIIIQHNIIDKDGNPTHKFRFTNGKGGFYLDYKAVTKKIAIQIIKSLTFEPTVFFFDRVNPATAAMAEYFKTKNTLVYFEPSSMRGSRILFDKCLVNSDIIKFANQRLPDASFTEVYKNKLFIQTLGKNGLRFNLFGKGWINSPAIPNNKIIDTSGAGDWTTATLLNTMVDSNIYSINDLTEPLVQTFLKKAQEKGSESCSYEGARGLMDKPK